MKQFKVKKKTLKTLADHNKTLPNDLTRQVGGGSTPACIIGITTLTPHLV